MDGQYLRRKGKIIVGANGELRNELFEYFHGNVLGGHSGVHGTRNHLSIFLYWKRITKNVKQWVKEYVVCQQCKSDNVAKLCRCSSTNP